ncbi:3'(2'),5'-bisphosphate nucleotidase CysQ [Croceicoccus marinus]|jgi:myo-inositol-1(or 4)-monophosphatase|uniref:3'(2'),5'-bisphosphate nucleotidase CysQ n=1 Tax=Croceicoccus marinus TaxID=450378 RepID=A0A7G6VUW5_9SPHN|nr:3'(2'),5'-bisphosphate nucleotidase CysQ [Croceicoccus marinus]QNE05530.1 3'(2'),5'-bisphosphate nucleotidase CysQ [Croceicoccus marinus]
MLDYTRFDAIMAEAARIAMAEFPGAGNATTSWRKEDDTPVCAADLAVNRFLAESLRKLLPSAGWLSEETADDADRTKGGLLWLVDPIDGTRDFLRGRAGWAVSVALVSNGRPLIARLAAPARGELWAAEAGRGARRNGLALRASARSDFAGARIPADAGLPLPPLVNVAKPNSIALRIALVASGEADLAASTRLGYEWDIGAAALIAREAGAVVTDAVGQQLAFNKLDPRAKGVLASAPAIHREATVWLRDRDSRLQSQ